MYDPKEMGGWKTGDMVRHCAHLGPVQMSRHVEVVGAVLQATNLTQTVEAVDKTKGSTIGQPFYF